MRIRLYATEKFLSVVGPLKQWNLIQAGLWQQLVNEGIVEPNDMVTFIQFAKAFADYYHDHNSPPTVNQLLPAVTV
jgi:hypothetical protein